jgi:hypothetical protein
LIPVTVYQSIRRNIPGIYEPSDLCLFIVKEFYIFWNTKWLTH